MTLDDKIKAFQIIGDFLKQFSQKPFSIDTNVPFAEIYFPQMQQLIQQSESHNGWFTEDQVIYALNSWAEALDKIQLEQWLSNYTISYEPLNTVGLILAGNIPMVGFHDVLSVLISGNKAKIKFSSNDQKIIPLLLEYLMKIEPRFADRIEIVKDSLQDFDAVIATGSNNTARYFEYYFSKVPNIIRKNRNSVAVLTGKESKEDLIALGEDIFRYYGLGCRSVSKLMVPKDYDFTLFFQAMYQFADVIQYEKYANNYDYNKAVFLMSEYKILDNGFLTIREDKSYASPIASVFYEYYDDLDQVKAQLEEDKDKIQCVVADVPMLNAIPFGQSQKPKLWDYADAVDTIDFLSNLAPKIN